MTDSSLPWASRFRPRTLRELVDNERAINELVGWVRSWNRGIPEKRAAFLFGPPGVGKTLSVVALANDLGFDLLEVNASDYRTGKRLEALIGRSAAQGFTVLGKRRMILLDELEGISGREDEGGISEIVQIIKETRNPVILVATSVRESWEEKFNSLREISLLIEFNPIPFEELLKRLRKVTREIGVRVDEDVLELIAERSGGDLRSSLNDLEAVARGREHVTLEDTDWLGERDRQSYTPEALMKIFSAKNLREARQAVSSAYISYDDLLEWIYENLPLVLDDPRDLAEGLDALARADIHENRAKKADYRLLKYMFNDMTGGVALSRRGSEGTGVIRQLRSKLMSLGFPPSAFTISESPNGIVVKPVRYLGNDWGRVSSALRELGGEWMRTAGFWVLPYFHPPQLVWRFRRTWHSRHMRDSVAGRVAAKCHVSTKEAVREVVPLLRIIFQGDEGMAEGIAEWLGLGDKEVEWLKSRQ